MNINLLSNGEDLHEYFLRVVKILRTSAASD